MKKPYQIETLRAVKQFEAMAAQGNPAVQMILPMAATKRTREAEAARRRLSIVDQVALFNQNRLDMFFNAKRSQRNDLRQQITANNATWSDEQKAQAQARGQRLATQLDRKQQEMQTDVNDAQSEVVDRIGRKMMDVLDRYARESGFVAVFDSSAQASPIIYAANSIDVTQEIIRLYDQAYPVKGGAGAPAAKPAAAAPKPATPAPAPKP